MPGPTDCNFTLATIRANATLEAARRPTSFGGRNVEEREIGTAVVGAIVDVEDEIRAGESCSRLSADAVQSIREAGVRTWAGGAATRELGRQLMEDVLKPHGLALPKAPNPQTVDLEYLQKDIDGVTTAIRAGAPALSDVNNQMAMANVERTARRLSGLIDTPGNPAYIAAVFAVPKLADLISALEPHLGDPTAAHWMAQAKAARTLLVTRLDGYGKR